MRLRCTINGREYPILQGATFSEEYNETLDSGSIIIDQVDQIDDLRPYDDVFVYSDNVDEFEGYDYAGEITADANAYTEMLEDAGTWWLYFSSEVKYISHKSNASEFVLRFRYSEATIEATYVFEGDYLFGDSVSLSRTSWKSYDAKAAEYILNGYVPQKLEFVRNAATGEFECLLRPEGPIYALDFIKGTFMGNSQSPVEYPYFYRHLLVDQFTEENINLTGKIYKYKIELMSETKKLETIQLPNVSITQPLNAKKKISVYDYLCRFVDMYSPVFKMATDEKNKTWNYQKKYTVSPTLKSVFGNVYAPDFSLNNPTLKDVLTQLMLTKDRIPYVKTTSSTRLTSPNAKGRSTSI